LILDLPVFDIDLSLVEGLELFLAEAFLLPLLLLRNRQLLVPDLPELAELPLLRLVTCLLLLLPVYLLLSRPVDGFLHL
jgi:hypothetical protein